MNPVNIYKGRFIFQMNFCIHMYITVQKFAICVIFYYFLKDKNTEKYSENKY